MKESVVERYFVKRAKALKLLVRKVRFLDRRGAPDRVLLLPNGIIFWVELKAPKKGPTVQQVREHFRLRRAGQSVYILSSKEEVDAFFDRVVPR